MSRELPDAEPGYLPFWVVCTDCGQHAREVLGVMAVRADAMDAQRDGETFLDYTDRRKLVLHGLQYPKSRSGVPWSHPDRDLGAASDARISPGLPVDVNGTLARDGLAWAFACPKCRAYGKGARDNYSVRVKSERITEAAWKIVNAGHFDVDVSYHREWPEPRDQTSYHRVEVDRLTSST